MRIGKVVGRVTLSQTYGTLVGGRFMIVEVQDRFALAGKPRKSAESVVVYDHLGAHDAFPMDRAQMFAGPPDDLRGLLGLGMPGAAGNQALILLHRNLLC